MFKEKISIAEFSYELTYECLLVEFSRKRKIKAEIFYKIIYKRAGFSQNNS